MKKYVLLITLFLGATFAQAQDLDNIKKMIILQQFEKVKPDIDSYLNNEKNAAKAEGWYYKAYVYQSLGRVATKSIAERKALLQGSFDAIKKYAALDPKATLTTEETNGTVFNMYYAFDDLGIKAYTDKNTEESYDLFKKALEVHDYVIQNNLTGYKGFKFSALDTSMVWNLAILANELKKKDEALIYYKQIADADLHVEKYASAYDALILKYKAEKNAELFNKYLTAAKKYYPIDKAYWEGQQIDYAIKGLENEALINKFEELTNTLPDNYYVFYNYGVELDRFVNSAESKGKDIVVYKQKTEDAFKKAIAINSSIEANLQLASIYYSRSFDAIEQAARIKGTKPAEVKLKNELTATGKESMNKCVPYAEIALKLLTALKEYKFSDKVNYKLALEILANAAKQNGNAAKVAEYNKQRDAVDKL